MITVKLYGLLSINQNVNQLSMTEGKVRDVFKNIIKECPDITIRQLEQAMIVINKKMITGRKRLTMELKDGDEIVFLHPSCGG